MDLIADMFVRINNAIKVQKELVDLPHSKIKEGLAHILLAEGYISKYETLTKMNKKYLRMVLKYVDRKKNIISGIKKVSTPGRKIYVGYKSIPSVQSGFGTAIVTTSKGLMTGEDAKAKKLGGEVLCYIW